MAITSGWTCHPAGQPCFRQRQRHIGRRRRHLPAAAGDLSSANGSSGETGPGSSTPSAPPSSDEDSLSAAEAASQVKKFGQSEWSSLVLSLPLELAAANQRMDSHFLQKRKRKYWWSKSGFPKVGQSVSRLLFSTRNGSKLQASTWPACCMPSTCNSSGLPVTSVHLKLPAKQQSGLPHAVLLRPGDCRQTGLLLLQVPPPEEVHFEEPPLSIWQKALPLALIFFCASFNLTILQVKLCLHHQQSSASCSALLRQPDTHIDPIAGGCMGSTM